MITHTVRVHVAALESITEIASKNLFAHSLQAGGAMAVLQGGCDPSVTRFQNLAAKMFNNGKYTFPPDEWFPAAPAVDPAVYFFSSPILAMLPPFLPMAEWQILFLVFGSVTWHFSILKIA